MDGYVSKPIRAEDLLEEIKRRVPQASPVPEEWSAFAEAGPAPGDVVDRGALYERVENDTALLAELVLLFLEDCPRLMAAICEAIAREDAKALERAAHALKGTVSNFAAPRAIAAALRLERMGGEGDLGHAAEGYATLEREIERLRPLLAELRQEIVQ